MLKADLYAENVNGKLSYKGKNMIVYFDDLKGESEEIIEKISPFPEHKEGQFMLYKLEFSRDQNAKLYLVEVSHE